MIRLPFLEDTTPPPFYLPKLTDKERILLDKWFIGLRSQQYYLKRFAEFDKQGKLYARWHWAAFVCTFGWLLYRKRYLDCLVYCVAGWSFIKVTIVIALLVAEFLILESMPEQFRTTVRIGIGLLVWVFWACVVARWADAYYYRMARREIADVVALYPQDLTTQKTHLQYHGGVSLVGLSVAMAIFAMILAVIVVQFMPMIIHQKERQVIYDSYRLTKAVKNRVATLYEQTGVCPTWLPVAIDGQVATLKVVDSVAGVKTACAVVATVHQARYPVRYLNGKTLVLYHTVDSEGKVLWRCQSSLNKQQKPKSCI